MSGRQCWGLLLLLAGNGWAQSPPYFVVAHVQQGKGMCGNHELVMQQELPAAEVVSLAKAKAQLKEVFDKKYPEGPYSQRWHSLVPPSQALIIYTFDREWKAWGCTNHAYGHVVAPDFAQAEQKLEAIRRDCPECKAMREVRRWPQPAAETGAPGTALPSP